MVASDVQAVSEDGGNGEDAEILTYSNPAKYLFNISKLTNNLYLCGACALRADTFDKLNITCVINCTTREELPDPPLPDRIKTYRRIAVLDSSVTNLIHYFHEIADTIRKVSQEGGNILVHCVAGVSRSVSLCLAYLLKYHKMSLKEAYEYVERRRPCIKPNNSFFKQLIDFEIENRGNPSISMILDESTQSYIPDIYERKFSNKLCCQMKVCQKRHCGTH
ncbi:hypothetical protein V9T40_003266 [Parthenolecanium corni]|uniref:Uncharacterized protein n=1 Tax=Parthenolecanium corni TaxID=536013 RepID=A0AAN9TSV0_9HEMI